MYAISFEIPRKTPLLTDAQVAGYRHLRKHKAEISRNAANALLLYYNSFRRNCPDWFEDEDGLEDCGPNPTLEQLSRCVSFTGVDIVRGGAAEMAPLHLSWYPDWDPEHGLEMGLYGEDVLYVGTDLNWNKPSAPDDDSWNTSHLTPKARKALRRFLSEYEFEEYKDGPDPAEREDIRTGAFSQFVEEQIGIVEKDYPLVRNWIRSQILIVFDLKGAFNLHDDDESRVVFDIMIWQTNSRPTGEPYPSQTSRRKF